MEHSPVLNQLSLLYCISAGVHVQCHLTVQLHRGWICLTNNKAFYSHTEGAKTWDNASPLGNYQLTRHIDFGLFFREFPNSKRWHILYTTPTPSAFSYHFTWTPISHSVLHGSLMVRNDPDSIGVESGSFIALIRSALNSCNTCAYNIRVYDGRIRIICI